MNKVAAILLAAALAAKAAPSDQLLFRNGDVLYGSLAAITPENTLRWRRMDAAAPMDFALSEAAAVNFTPRSLPAASNLCKVVFDDGDAICGQWAGGQGTDILLDTSWAGRLALPRSAVRSLAVETVSPPLYEGPDGMEGWTDASLDARAGSWRYRRGAFYADAPSCAIARFFQIPEMARIEFDVAWKGAPEMAIAFFTDSLRPVRLGEKDTEPDFGGFYSLRIYGGGVEMRTVRKHVPMKSLGMALVPSLAASGKAHFDLRVDKAAAKFILLVDGTLAAAWQDSDGFIAKGDGLRFVQNAAGPARLSHVRISQWDGVVEHDMSVDASLTTDVVWLEGGRHVDGEISDMAPKFLTLLATGETRHIPLESVRALEFKTQSAPAAAAATNAMGVRASLAEGGSIHAALESWSPDAVWLRSPDFGQAAFKPAAFTTLEFLPLAEDADGK